MESSGTQVDLIEGMNREELVELFTRAMLLTHGKDIAVFFPHEVACRSLDALRERTREAELDARTPFRFMARFMCDECASASGKPLRNHFVIVRESHPPSSDDELIAKYACKCCSSHPTHPHQHLLPDKPLVTIRVRCDACVDPATNRRGHTMTMNSDGVMRVKGEDNLAQGMYDKFVQQHSSLHPSHSTMLHLL